MGSMSVMHWMVLLVIILILFGAGRLPRVMGDFAKGIKAFKSGMQEEETASAAPPVTGPAVAAPYMAQPAPQPQPVHATPAQPAYAPQAAHVPPVQPPAAPPTVAPVPPAPPAASHPGTDYRTGSAA